MWRNFGALMGARLQGYSTRACNYTQDTRPSCASCRVQFLHMLVYVHVCASTCKHGRSRAVFCTIYSSRNRFLGVFARSRGWMRCFFHRNDREPIDRFVLFFLPLPSLYDQTISRPTFFLRTMENELSKIFSRIDSLILDWIFRLNLHFIKLTRYLDCTHVYTVEYIN